MDFVPDYPIIRFLHALINTPGIGGIVVGLVGGGSLLAYGLALRWIKKGAQVPETETYAYPTPALHHQE